MLEQRRDGLGRGALALAFVATAAGAVIFGTGVEARPHAAPSPSPAPSLDPNAMTAPVMSDPQAAPTVLGIPGPPTGRMLNAGQPTPYPLTTLAPLGTGTPRPFPVYGTPVPGIDNGRVLPDVPATITLQQAIAVGFARSPALRVARADVAVQDAAVRLQRAGLLPSFSGSSSLSLTHSQEGGGGSTISTGTGTTGTTGTTTGTAISGFGPYTSRNASFALSLAQLIYDGNKIVYAVDAARFAEASTADTYKRDLQTVAYNVANAYYAYLAAERTTQVDLEVVREDVVQENLVRAQVRAGTSARADIATAQLPTAQARLAVVRAQGAELAAEATFVNAMGLDANANVQPIDDAPVFTATRVSTVPVPTYDAAVAQALALRPDYDAGVQTVKQARYSLRSAGLGLFPTLAASASAEDASTSQNAGAFRNNQSIGLSLSVPIFDQGITSANVASARATLDIATATLDSDALTVQLNVKQTLANLVAAHAALEETQQEYATAVVNVQSTQAQYRAGVTTLPLLLNAQVQLTQALTDQVSAVYALRENEQAYLYALGQNYDPSKFSLPTLAKNGKPVSRVARVPDLIRHLISAIR